MVSWTLRARLTVTFYLAVSAFEHHAEFGPFGKVFQVEADVIGFGEMVKIAWVKVEEVLGCHGPYGRHAGDVTLVSRGDDFLYRRTSCVLLISRWPER